MQRGWQDLQEEAAKYGRWTRAENTLFHKLRARFTQLPLEIIMRIVRALNLRAKLQYRRRRALPSRFGRWLAGYDDQPLDEDEGPLPGTQTWWRQQFRGPGF